MRGIFSSYASYLRYGFHVVRFPIYAIVRMCVPNDSLFSALPGIRYMISPLFFNKKCMTGPMFLDSYVKGPTFLASWYIRIFFAQRLSEAAWYSMNWLLYLSHCQQQMGMKSQRAVYEYEGRLFNCVTNGPPYRVAARSTWKLLWFHGGVIFYNRIKFRSNPFSLSKVFESSSWFGHILSTLAVSKMKNVDLQPV